MRSNGLYIILGLLALFIIGCNGTSAPEIVLKLNPELTDIAPKGTVALSVDAIGEGLSFKWSVENGTLSNYERASVIYTAPDSLGKGIVTVKVKSDAGESYETVTFNIVNSENEAGLLDVENSPTPTLDMATPTTDGVPNTTTPTPFPTFTPTYTPTPVPTVKAGSLIAYASNASTKDGNWDIVVQNMETGQKTNITEEFSSSWEKNPVWSPDGTQIAFETNRMGYGNWEIYVMNADGSEPRRLTNDSGDDLSPTWSPDGSQIAFQSNRTGINQIYTVAANSSGFPEMQTDGTGQNYAPDWSPDGQRIAYYSRVGVDLFHIRILDLATKESKMLDGSVNDTDPSWSPDGNRIAFLTWNNIAVMDANGQNRNILFDEGSYNLNPSWSPDGEYILFDSDFGSTPTTGEIYNIYQLDKDGKNRLQITDSNSRPDSKEQFGNIQPDWQPGNE